MTGKAARALSRQLAATSSTAPREDDDDDDHEREQQTGRLELAAEEVVLVEAE